ncbi:MAG: PDZ domain-containing protein [Planctomycetes bacterium]|nr:PDZ domain-containing protein [Planctomycetota bacterium]
MFTRMSFAVSGLFFAAFATAPCPAQEEESAPPVGKPAAEQPAPAPAATPTDEEIAGWVKDLGAEKFEARAAAREKLVKAGRRAVPALRDAADSDDPEVAAAASEILAQVRRNARAAGRQGEPARPRGGDSGQHGEGGAAKPAEEGKGAPQPATPDEAFDRMRRMLEEMRKNFPGSPGGNEPGEGGESPSGVPDINKMFDDLMKQLDEGMGQLPDPFAEKTPPGEAPEAAPGEAPKGEGQKPGVARRNNPFGRMQDMLRNGMRSFSGDQNETVSVEQDESGYRVTVTTNEGGKPVARKYEAANEEEFKAKYPEVYQKAKGGGGPLQFRFFSGRPGGPGARDLPPMPELPAPLRRFFGGGGENGGGAPGESRAPEKSAEAESDALGARLAPPSEEMRAQLGLGEDEGLVVRSLNEKKSLIARAGIQKHDVITKVNGRKVGDADEARQAVADAEEGAEITFEIIRKGERSERAAKK